MSASALSAVCKELAVLPAPELRQPKHLAEAAEALFRDATPHGPVFVEQDLVDSNGEPACRACFANLWALLHVHLSREGSLFAEHVWRQLTEHPSSPSCRWRTIIYIDEVVPGNALGLDQRRKVWTLYVSFVELGAHALHREAAWLCLSVMRSSQLAKAKKAAYREATKVWQKHAS